MSKEPGAEGGAEDRSEAIASDASDASGESVDPWGFGPRESRVGLPLPEEAFNGSTLLEREHSFLHPHSPSVRESLRDSQRRLSASPSNAASECDDALSHLGSEAGSVSLASRRVAAEKKLCAALRSRRSLQDMCRTCQSSHRA